MIDRLTLINFKAFQQADIPLGPLTLLTGLNSSGKSTVLQALALLRQSYTSGNLGYLDEEAGFLLNGEFVGLGTGQDVLHDDFAGDDPLITVGVAEGPYRYEWTVDYAPEQNLLPLMSVALPVSEEGSQSPEGEAALTPGYFRNGFQYLHADRITPTEGFPRDHHMAVRRGFLGSRGEHTVNFLRLHARETVPEGPLRHPAAAGELLLDHVAAWMGELCPGVNIETDTIEGMDSVRLSYGFGEGALASRHRHRPANVGFGLTYALPIVVACLTAAPGTLVLLENPEAHLHPRGQTKMAELAAASAAQGAQLVVETHSDHVLNGMRLAVKRGLLAPEQAVIHYFRSAGDGSGAEVISPRLDHDGLLDQWPKGFFDEMDHVLDQLLT
ncbi:DUF3696 domain-containing protein [Streptomyces sp. NPDC001848]|uniref:AAA family ATPase n=1 Tax=Streptomyces sp. NPDC001848 TaxID=3364618 RepID=UPI0036ACC1A3